MRSGKLRFGDYELDYGEEELRRLGRPVQLERIPLRLLLILASRPDHLVSREEIAASLWGDGVFLDVDSAINTAILKLRRVFKDDPRRPDYIKTISGRGYRFVADAEELPVKNSPARAIPIDRRERVMLAVLPFENLSSDAEQDYFSDGLTEETICRLGSLHHNAIGVIARTSSMAYKGVRRSIAEIGRELGVAFVLESSVRREGHRMCVSSQLIRVADQTHVWAASFDSDTTDSGGYLSMQHELSLAIAEQVHFKLLPQSGGFTHWPQCIDAFDLYLRGRYHWNQLTPPAIQRAISCFEQAIAVEPGYALAWSGLADCYSMLPITCDAPPIEIVPKALAAALKAIELDDTLAEAHTSLGTVKVWMDWDWPGAEKALVRALDINPSYVQAHRYYACLLSHTGRHDASAVEMEKARALDPLSPIMHALSGQLRGFARDYISAVRHLRDAQVIRADLWIVHAFLGRIHECEGRLAEAISEYTRAFEVSAGGNTEPIAFRARAYALMGNRQAALDALNMLLDMATKKFVPPYNIATIHAGLGEAEKALWWLEKAWEARDVRLVFLLVDPRWDAFRQDERFRNLAGRMNLLSSSLNERDSSSAIMFRHPILTV